MSKQIIDQLWDARGPTIGKKSKVKFSSVLHWNLKVSKLYSYLDGLCPLHCPCCSLFLRQPVIEMSSPVKYYLFPSSSQWPCVLLTRTITLVGLFGFSQQQKSQELKEQEICLYHFCELAHNHTLQRAKVLADRSWRAPRWGGQTHLGIAQHHVSATQRSCLPSVGQRAKWTKILGRPRSTSC